MLDSEKNVLNANDNAHATSALKSYAIPSILVSILCIAWTYTLDNQATIVAVIGWFSTMLWVVAWHLINLYRLYKTDNVFAEAVNTVIEKVETLESETKTNTSVNQ